MVRQQTLNRGNIEQLKAELDWNTPRAKMIGKNTDSVG
jgi:hypothetical protein